MILNNIKGYIDMAYEQQYNEKDMWEGNILLSENGYFEGIVVDELNSQRKESFIFGVYYPGRFIKLFKIGEKANARPVKYAARIEGIDYEGNFYEIELFGEVISGNCKMAIENRDLEQNTEIDEALFQSKIDEWKKRKMDPISRDFYNRKVLAIKRISEKELETEISGCNPVNKNLMEPAIYYKLVRKMINIFQPED